MAPSNMIKWADGFFDGDSDLRDEYYDKLFTSPVKDLREDLEQVVRIINDTSANVKQTMLECEKVLGKNIFRWEANFCTLTEEELQAVEFCYIHFSLENIWMERQRLPNIWLIFDQ